MRHLEAEVVGPGTGVSRLLAITPIAPAVIVTELVHTVAFWLAVWRNVEVGSPDGDEGREGDGEQRDDERGRLLRHDFAPVLCHSTTRQPRRNQQASRPCPPPAGAACWGMAKPIDKLVALPTQA
jgi:hypothetical protein